MGEHRFEIPASEHSSQWHELSPAARESLIGNTLGRDQTDALLGGLVEGEGMSNEVTAWAWGELMHCHTQWRSTYGNDVPLSTDGLQIDLEKPENVAKITRFFDLREDLKEFGTEALTPNGTPVGNNMNLVLIPWQIMLKNLGRLEDWLNDMRTKQGLVHEEYINGTLLQACQGQGKLLYLEAGSQVTHVLTPKKYLETKVEQDGPWGVMLAQTSNESGLADYRDQTPDQLTGTGTHPFIWGTDVLSNMGLFEWIALTLQEDPRRLSAETGSWLLANRIVVDGEECVPCASFEDIRGGTLNVRLFDADKSMDAYPRWGVL